MKNSHIILIFLTLFLISGTCKKNEKSTDVNIIFLHHSTGEVIWNGGPPTIIKKAAGRISGSLADHMPPRALLPKLFESYNKEYATNYQIQEREFPKAAPYGWNNNPYDYYNIWVHNAGEEPFLEEPTLEILTRSYQVIIFKHCYPVSNIQPDKDTADINSYYRSLSNYKLQYLALRDKLSTFRDIKFIIFTGAAQVKANITEEEALRAKEFFTWVINEWDIPDDNIFIWDLYNLETEGGLYLKEEYAIAPSDSHPNKIFAREVVKLLFNRIIDIIENQGKSTTVKGECK